MIEVCEKVCRFSAEVQERFWKKVEVLGPDECWQWTASKARGGYGQFCFQKRPERAHRISYEITNGPIPPGLCVCHKCDDPGCCNPNHLFLGTNAENMTDKVEKGRQARVQGSDQGSSKLTEVDIPLIVAAYESGLTLAEVGVMFGVRGETVRGILRGDEWPHVPGSRPGCRPTVKLTWDFVRAIRADYATGNFTQKALAEKHGVHRASISFLVRRKTWKHLT
jgi:hypothetical protein